jgi:membrane associated rhomboid family serine protease
MPTPRAEWSVKLLPPLVGWVWLSCFVVAVMLEKGTPQTGLSATTLLGLGALRVPPHSALDYLRVASCWLLHVDLWHLLSNLVVLMVIAWRWTPRAGAMWPPLLLGVVGAGCFSLLLSLRPMVSCGGSGVLLSLLVVLLLSVQSWRERVVPGLVAMLLLGGGLLTGADGAAHLGGLVAGGLAVLLRSRRKVTA